MAKSKNPVNSQMGSKLPSVAGPTKVGKYPVHTVVKLGEGTMPTPTQTAGANTRPPRPGTVQNHYGSTST